MEIANDLGFPAELGPEGLLRFIVGILPTRFADEVDKIFRPKHVRFEAGQVQLKLKLKFILQVHL